jgi:hypothetical protein
MKTAITTDIMPGILIVTDDLQLVKPYRVPETTTHNLLEKAIINI